MVLLKSTAEWLPIILTQAVVFEFRNPIQTQWRWSMSPVDDAPFQSGEADRLWVQYLDFLWGESSHD